MFLMVLFLQLFVCSFVFLTIIYFTVAVVAPQWGAADAEIKVPSGENTELLNVLPFKPGVGQYIAIHATLTAREFFHAYFYPSSPFTCIFPNPLPISSCVGCG